MQNGSKTEKKSNKQKRSTMEILGTAMLFLGFLLILCVGIYYLTGSLHNSRNRQIAKQFHKGNIDAKTETDTSENGEEVEPELEFDWSVIDNDDLICWVYIPDSKIDFPVVQTKDNTFYLNHGYDRKYNGRGAIFMDSSNNVHDLTQNLIMYGHHMKDGGMFAGLDAFKDKEFAKSHDTIYLYYPNGAKETFKVAAAFYWDEEGMNFPYHEYTDLSKDTNYDSVMTRLLKYSIYGKTDVLKDAYDGGTRRLVMLSTCDYRTSNSRFVLVGTWTKDDL